MAASAVTKHTITPAERASVREVSELLARRDSRGGAVKLVVEPRDGEAQCVTVSETLVEAIGKLSALMQTGEKVSMFADDPEITPEQAAEILGMSRPMVVHNVKCGALKSRMVGAHHRIAISDVLAFREKEAQRHAAFAEFTTLGEEMFLKYGE